MFHIVDKRIHLQGCCLVANAGATPVAMNANADILYAPTRVGASRSEEVRIDVLRK